MHFRFFIFLFFFAVAALAESAPPSDVSFSALNYSRDAKAETMKLSGKAWLKRGTMLLEADEIEVDYKTNEATGTGNVHFKQGKMDMFCDKGVYSLSGEKATLNNATVLSEKIVFTGKVIRRLTRDAFEMEEGLYTNCNTKPVLDRSVRQCYFDWKVYGRFFDVVIDGYLNVYDAILYAKDLPVAYLPYYRAPVKTQRQSGFLYPTLIPVDELHGSGVTVPYFWAINDWQDLTFSPSQYSKAGFHGAASYRYAYSADKTGGLDLFFIDKGFSDDRSNPQKVMTNGGFPGGWAMSLGNVYSLGGEARTNQNLSFVSDPFYTTMYGNDLGTAPNLAYLKSQISVTVPDDNWLYTGVARYDQSLIMTKEKGVDNGPVGQLPSLGIFKKTAPFLNYLSYDFDMRFNNFYRLGRGIDKVPDPAIGRDLLPDFDANDYIREGRRLQLEPRLTLNLPLPKGFELLPEVRAGTLLYHFDYGESNFVTRNYVDLQVPFSLYMTKHFATDISNFEVIRHVLQPKITYVKALYRSAEPTHQFFYDNRTAEVTDNTTRLRQGLSNPRFDILDQVLDYHYGRVELLNTFYRRIATGYEKFLLFSLAQQVNIKVLNTTGLITNNNSGTDPLGPIEARLEINYGSFSFQAQANYRVKQSYYEITSGLNYSGPIGTAQVTYNKRHNADPNAETENIELSASKTLPTFFDVATAFNWYPYKGYVRSYSAGLSFAAKPYSCWKLDVVYQLVRSDRDTLFQNSVALRFGLNFGGNIVFGL